MIASLPADRQDPDDRRNVPQVHDRPAIRLSAQRSELRRKLPAYDVRGAVRALQGQPDAGARRSTASSSCTPITSRTPRPRPCGWSARPAPAPMPPSPPASPHCGGRPMAAPTRRWSRCWREIGSIDRIPEFIEKAKDKDSHSRLMGFGHRVYKNYDPRAGVLKESADEVLELLGQKNNPEAGDRQGAGADRAQRRVFRPAQAVPERRLLFGDHPRGDGHPDHDVHRHLRAGANGGLDGAVERDDRGSRSRRSAGRGSATPATPSGAYVPIEQRAEARLSGRLILALNSASAASAPSHRALPPNFHTPEPVAQRP